MCGEVFLLFCEMCSVQLAGSGSVTLTVEEIYRVGQKYNLDTGSKYI